MDIKEKWTNLVKKIYKNNKTKIKIDKTTEKFITKGLKQGYFLSPLLFNLYTEQSLENWCRKCSRMGIGDWTFYIHYYLWIIKPCFHRMKKTGYIKIKLWGSKISGKSIQSIRKDIQNIKYDAFKYIETTFISNGTCEKEIWTCMGQKYGP